MYLLLLFVSFAVQCLASAMTALEIPETLKTGSFQNDWEGNGTYTLKERVVKWLLFCCVEEGMEDSMELPPVLFRYAHEIKQPKKNYLFIGGNQTSLCLFVFNFTLVSEFRVLLCGNFIVD